METKFRVTINTEILVWARETIGLEIQDAARKIGVSEDVYKNWELGESKPTVKQLRTIASKYKRPVATFYLPKVPEGIKPIHDFRILRGEPKFTTPPKLALEIRRAIVRREIASELLDYLGEEVKPFKRLAHLRDDIERLSMDVRSFLGITPEEQYKWKDEFEALRKWKELIENASALVFQASRVPLSIMRGFSVSEEVLPIIVVNSADSPRARIFTIIHELGHLLLSDGGLCDLRELPGIVSEEQRTEIFCNYLAGGILVPRDELLLQPLVQEKTYGTDWEESELQIVADKFKVSKQVVLRRLLITRKISEEFYKKKSEEYEDFVSHLRTKKSKGGPTVARKVVASNGIRFTRLVLDAYHGDKITASDLSNYLGAKLQHLSEIQKEVGY